MASAWLSLRIQQGGATIWNSFCCETPDETFGDEAGREVKKISDSSSVLEVKTEDGVSCPLNIPLNILMERGMLDMVVVYLVSDSKEVNSTSSAFDRLMSSAKREDLLPDKKYEQFIIRNIWTSGGSKIASSSYIRSSAIFVEYIAFSWILWWPLSLKGYIFKCVCHMDLIFWQDLPVNKSIQLTKCWMWTPYKCVF